ncbi:helix-turn-helix domain-containing protein [Caulobacter vibrioides]|uniref:helix-turn-helix domain-containing protein n=1 Tax=Caulobacter vibrioides TaxID=155892 RepID=UPI000BB4DFC8|nr:helix-turn-helix domain-containing protein [Caulobacter vibrioides]ATC26473.1 DNA-binding protein [Caulobacter vibrioides]PLR12295.1 DNA-binding protein [Caulobacter vibrioides]
MIAASEKLSYRMDEAAEATGLSKATLYRLIERGELTTLKVGTRTLIRREVLEGLLQRLEVASTPPRPKVT